MRIDRIRQEFHVSVLLSLLRGLVPLLNNLEVLFGQWQGKVDILIFLLFGLFTSLFLELWFARFSSTGCRVMLHESIDIETAGHLELTHYGCSDVGFHHEENIDVLVTLAHLGTNRLIEGLQLVRVILDCIEMVVSKGFDL
jgi:hypothetical protein